MNVHNSVLQAYMTVYCYQPSAYIGLVYLPYVNVAQKTRRQTDPRENCQMTITRSSIPIGRKPEKITKFSNTVSTKNTDQSLFHGILSGQTYLFNISWNEAAELCDNFDRKNQLKASLFTYLMESELQDLTDRLEKQGFLDGSPLIIFTGFTGDSVSNVWLCVIVCWYLYIFMYRTIVAIL